MSESEEFKPIPYSFALIDIYKKPFIMKGNILAICPSFHILLDHTIAVIWMLFSLKHKDPVPLGSDQISWALRFLEGMTNDYRVDSCGVDIKKAIECLQCAFVNCISQEHPFNTIDGENNESGTETKRIEENDKILNLGSCDSGQEGDKVNSILLKDMFRK